MNMTKDTIATFMFPILAAFAAIPSFAADVHEAAKTGDYQKIQELVENDPNVVNLKDGSGRTPLHWAARNDHLDIVEFLAKRGADIDPKDNLGNSPLYYSIWLGKSFGIVKCLIDNGADVNFRSDRGVCLLFLSAREGKEKIAELLVENKANPDQQDDVGKTPLFMSVEAKNQSLVDLLLKHKANISIKDKFGRTPLHQASIEGYVDIAGLLLANGADINEKDDAGKTALYYAGKHGHERLAALLESKGGNAEETVENFGFFPMLKKSLRTDEAVIWYLGHAGWAVRTRSAFLIFDYWERGIPDQPLLANGRINPEEIKDLDVYVFSSHEHYDHYDGIIFEWEKTIDRLTYIFGWQNDKGKNHIRLSPREGKKTGNIEVFLVNSPEADPLDNAFLVKADGISIYHAGDYGLLGGIEKITPVYDQDMHFLREKADKLDIMFMACQMINGKVPEFAKFSLETVKPKVFFPMHDQSREYLFQGLVDEIAKAGYGTHLIAPENRGDVHIYQGGKIKKY